MSNTTCVKVYSLKGLDKAELSEKSIVVSLLEVDQPFLPSMSPEEMNLLRRVTDKTTDLLWVTAAGMLEGSNPDSTLASGLSRALMLEQPALRFAILDIGNAADNISLCQQVDRALSDSDVPGDKEFTQSKGLLHISRFVPDKGLNDHFSQRRRQKPILMTLQDASPARIAIEDVGLMDSIYFQQELEVNSLPAAGYVDVDVKAVSLNAKVHERLLCCCSLNADHYRRIYMSSLGRLRPVQALLQLNSPVLSRL